MTASVYIVMFQKIYFLSNLIHYQVSYYMHEETGWSLQIPELQRALDEARKHCNPVALVVINPGNPTGRSNLRSFDRLFY